MSFAKEHNIDLDTWRLMLKCLQDKLSSKSEHEESYTAMQEILDHLAKTLMLDTFMDILPGSQSNDDFQSYIQLCRKNQQAHQIQNLIVNTGHKLLSTLTFWKVKRIVKLYILILIINGFNRILNNLYTIEFSLAFMIKAETTQARGQ